MYIKTRKRRTVAQKHFVDGSGIQATLPPGILWRPHKTNGYLVVCVKYHLSPSGFGLKKGYTIRFATPEMRNKWLASQYPKRYGKLATKGH